MTVPPSYLSVALYMFPLNNNSIFSPLCIYFQSFVLLQSDIICYFHVILPSATDLVFLIYSLTLKL